MKEEVESRCRRGSGITDATIAAEEEVSKFFFTQRRKEELIVLVAANFDHEARRLSSVRSRFVHQIELPHLDHTQTRKQLRFPFAKLLVGDLFQLVAHLQLEQLFLDHAVVVQLLIGHLLNLAEDKL